MSYELKRVPQNFTWPLKKAWSGYENNLYTAIRCDACDGTGNSPEVIRLADMWYGKAPFRPEDRGSLPVTADTLEVRDRAERNQHSSRGFRGNDEIAILREAAIVREANRLADLWNAQWAHHLDQNNVNALVEAGRLIEFTHTWSNEDGWIIRDPVVIPTTKDVNRWSLGGMGHDGINYSIVVQEECKRLGINMCCKHCDGESAHWPSEEARIAYETWERTEPPTGDAYQVWQTVSDGSPISPAFSTPKELARYMVKHPWGADQGSSIDTWMAFIEGPGWCPSMMTDRHGRLVDGLNAIVDRYY